MLHNFDAPTFRKSRLVLTLVMGKHRDGVVSKIVSGVQAQVDSARDSPYSWLRTLRQRAILRV